ncbi:MAG TPA: rRNA maturation RNase YbeY [Thermoanaerobaculia bacterium]|nr:rRNA maturation RNase YbeY [Thermoanaerobaculia bacterium]
MNVEVSGIAVPRFSRREIAAFVRKILLRLDKDEHVAEVSIAFVDDEAMKKLNRQFRHKNRTTDVLTFAGDGSFLGDVVISVEQARRQATDERHSIATEVRYLLIHGVLHALGYDHETDRGEMNELEVDLRDALGLD